MIRIFLILIFMGCSIPAQTSKVLTDMLLKGKKPKNSFSSRSLQKHSSLKKTFINENNGKLNKSSTLFDYQKKIGQLAVSLNKYMPVSPFDVRVIVPKRLNPEKEYYTLCAYSHDKTIMLYIKCSKDLEFFTWDTSYPLNVEYLKYQLQEHAQFEKDDLLLMTVAIAKHLSCIDPLRVLPYDLTHLVDFLKRISKSERAHNPYGLLIKQMYDGIFVEFNPYVGNMSFRINPNWKQRVNSYEIETNPGNFSYKDSHYRMIFDSLVKKS